MTVVASRLHEKHNLIIIMLKYLILCWLVIQSVTYEDMDNYLEEGSLCESDAIRGICLVRKRCYSVLSTRNRTLPKCGNVPAGKSVVCCGDCDFVDDISKAVISPTGGTFWQTGNKARDNCLQYLKYFPYKCRESFTGGVDRIEDQEKGCHKVVNWSIRKNPTNNENKNRSEYPHQALLGYGYTIETAAWLAGGSIISDRFILTAAHVKAHHEYGELNFVALEVLNTSNTLTLQFHKVRRFIEHPSYNLAPYYDIALIETETQISFNYNVLPACLPVEKMNVTEAVATTWWDLEEEGYELADTIQTIRDIEVFPEEKCNSAYNNNLYRGFDKKRQMCFASKKYPSDSCRGFSGEPLLINNQFSSCLYTVVGVTSIGALACGPTEELQPQVYTRVSYFVPWIESVVWP